MKTTKNTALLAVSLIFLLCALPTLAAAGAKCSLPKNCTYLDSEFSTGGGNKASYVMEVTCKMPNNTIVKYTSWKLSAGNLFGMGRLTAPKKIVFAPGNKDELVCDY